jgi:geranylgeranyl diphosphate synthase type II
VIIENKKHTYILKQWRFLKKDAAQLHLFTMQLEDNVTKIESVKDIFNNSGASKANQDAIQEYTFKAFETLEK